MRTGVRNLILSKKPYVGPGDVDNGWAAWYSTLLPDFSGRSANVATRLEHCSHRRRHRVGWILPVYGLVLTTFWRPGSARA
jgi:hypothetical protein